MDIGTLLQLVASAIGLLAIWRLADRNVSALYWAMASNAASTVVIGYSHLWGLLPINLVTYFVHTRNIMKWTRAQSA
jgi:hypothetical protein